MGKMMEIGTARARQGEKGLGVLTVGWTNDAAAIDVPVMLVNGAANGPCLWVQGGSHGNEYVGTMAIQDWYRELDPVQLRGSVVLLPVINILAFRAGTRAAPQDGLDMNRVWPGYPIRQARHIYAHTELVVDALARHLEQYADAVVDCHSGGWPHLMSSYAQYFIGDDRGLSERSRGMAEAALMDLVWATTAEDYNQKSGGSIGTYLNQIGRPCITLEVGGQGRVAPADLDRMHRALRGIGVHLGLGNSGPLPVEREPLRVTRGHWLRAQRGGVLYPLVRPLDRVQAGQPVARITDLLGAELEILTAPADGVVVGHRTVAMVNTGEYVCNVGEYIGGGQAA